MDDLTPCAHCGDDAQFVEHVIEGLWGVECTSCLSKMLYTALTKSEAAEHWNLRGPATRLAEVEAERDGLLHRIAEAMKEQAAKVCDERGADERSEYGLNRAAQNYFRARNAIRAIDTAALVKDVCDAD